MGKTYWNRGRITWVKENGSSESSTNAESTEIWNLKNS